MLLAGASGLVGGLVLGLCRDAIPITRRPIGRPGVVADFDDLPPLPQAQVAVCALGTTRAKAGSDAAFRAVDHDAVLAFARAAKAAGVTHFILVSSVGANPKATDAVKVNYHGWLDGGKVFDSSYQRGEAIEFGLNQVIPGWTEGMQLVGKGGMIELVIPSNLGYGPRGTPGGPIPPNATLHFLVELLDVK
jgi:FKBP-type peptidyl-prolyl cis-trans isomerase